MNLPLGGHELHVTGQFTNMNTGSFSQSPCCPLSLQVTSLSLHVIDISLVMSTSASVICPNVSIPAMKVLHYLFIYSKIVLDLFYFERHI